MKTIRIIVAGTRTYCNGKELYDVLDSVISTDYTTRLKSTGEESRYEIVSGCARGADTLAIQYAKDNGYNLKKFQADWGTYGKSAGYRRNIQMAEYVTESGVEGILVAFWDSKSKGTKHMIDIASKYNIDTKIMTY